jgi:XTP/dITP diphosphohydrolase
MNGLLIATGNAGKLREFGALLPDLVVTSPAALGLRLEVAENGESFAANARLKALAFAAASQHVVLADDSGLEVDALGGAPGVLSARYGGPGLDDRGRCHLLLTALAAWPAAEQRRARFRCTVVAMAPDGRSCAADGVCEGVIAAAPSGKGGFGYDPVFYLPECGCTMAEVEIGRKNQLSHRARALAALRPLLPQVFPELMPR